MVYTIAVEAGTCEPRRLARELCLIMEGAYVTRQVGGNRDAIDIARGLAKLAIEAACPVRTE